MIELSFEQLNAFIGGFWWPFCRVLGCMFFMPVIGESHVPKLVKIGLAMMFSGLLAHIIPQPAPIEMISIAALWLSFQEFFIGFMLALALQIMLHTLTLIGTIISAQMGLSMAVVNDPSSGGHAPLVGELLLMFGILIFLTIDGHLVFFGILSDSFTLLPIGQSIFQLHLLQLVERLGWMIAAAIMLSLPAIVAMLIINLTFGALNRSAPSLNIYSLGFPLSLLMGLLCVLLLFYGLAPRYSELCLQSLNFILIFIKGS